MPFMLSTAILGSLALQGLVVLHSIIDITPSFSVLLYSLLLPSDSKRSYIYNAFADLKLLHCKDSNSYFIYEDYLHQNYAIDDINDGCVERTEQMLRYQDYVYLDEFNIKIHSGDCIRALFLNDSKSNDRKSTSFYNDCYVGNWLLGFGLEDQNW
jgi:hypothetical protein